ncbi:hypothetical protein PISMIDRAFT_672220 [Pisolithus microcarpus 441]|uniref:Uncharacterized protein n=1 Tax=Pisolithus microcarpus 441 TaxID=765257 RepID=A0A0C9ZJS0_9AGAM|nr:hypothetical protein PISMIDRAFT_672220 [Pisolithus microcarpus 441]
MRAEGIGVEFTYPFHHCYNDNESRQNSGVEHYASDGPSSLVISCMAVSIRSERRHLKAEGEYLLHLKSGS